MPEVLGPETLKRAGHPSRASLGWWMTPRRELLAHVAAWEEDLAISKAIHERCAALQRRVEALERAAAHALSDLRFVESAGGPGSNLQASIRHLEAALEDTGGAR